LKEREEERKEEREEKWALIQELALACASSHFERVKSGPYNAKILYFYNFLYASSKLVTYDMALGL
jgi:hypothetical protein